MSALCTLEVDGKSLLSMSGHAVPYYKLDLQVARGS